MRVTNIYVSRGIVVVLALALCGACAAPFRRVPPAPAPSAGAAASPGARTPPRRPLVGVAFGGGSARGLAHVGVIRWFEEHRIPIDLVAGTSMGGLVGGAFASGMDAAELQRLVVSADWDQLLGDSTFAPRNIRRKADARAYPSRLEHGLKHGIVAPMALNNGEYVDRLLDRITAPYFEVDDFDDLPTPFRAVAVDLLTAQTVVLERGVLAQAMRATMSLPVVFPPVEADGRLLIDGGTMNNVPADVAKAMGADRVVAVNVGDLSNRGGVNPTMFGIAGSTLDAMMRASTRRAVALADVVIDVPTAYGSLDWRRAADLIEDGYRAAEAMRDRLLPLAVSETEFAAWRSDRQVRRRATLPVPTFVQLEGFVTTDAKRLKALLVRNVGVSLDVDALEHDLAVVTGLDRYESVTWRLVNDGARGSGLRVQGRLKTHAPPFLMLGLNVENTTSTDFRITAVAGYLAFDTVGSGSELRVEGAAGSDPAVGVELYRPIGSTPVFVAPYAGIGRMTFNFVNDAGDAVVARYRRTRTRLGLNVGVNLGPRSDVRAGAYVGQTAASISVGDPGLPELRGTETGAEMVWRLNTQDSPVVPSRGVQAELRLAHVFDGPDVVVQDRTVGVESSLTQLSGDANQFWSLGPRNRVFVYGGFGTSFDRTPFPTDQFALGMPFRLGAYRAGELRGNHYYVATGGYLRRVARLPGFIGGPVFAGAWLANGDVFDAWRRAGFRSNGGAGVLVDTLLGPLILGGSWGFDGRWRLYFATGRLFR